jgi:hypothetical protein
MNANSVEALKQIIVKILKFIDKIYTIPKMTCYACIKEDCVNRAYRNEICVGYKKR